MSETPQSPDVKSISGKLFLRRASSLLSWRRIFGPIITVFGLFLSAIHWGWIAADIFGRLDVVWRVVEAMGGTPAMIATLLSSWWFSLALIIGGVAYTVFVGEPEKGTQRHHWWPYAAGAFLILWLTAIGGVFAYGWFELKMRQAYDQGVAGVPRAAPGEANPSRPQTPFATNNWGTITPDQMRILVQELPKLPLKNVQFFLVAGNNTSYSYWHQFNDVFQRSGIGAPLSGNQLPRGPQEEGLMLEVHDKNNIPESAQKLLEVFEIANIKINVIDAPSGILGTQDFAVFIGPAPIRWR